MGIGKKAVEHKTKKTVEKATEGIPVVGDMVDKRVSTGPMDRAEDALDDGKDRVSDALDEGKDKLPKRKKGK